MPLSRSRIAGFIGIAAIVVVAAVLFWPSSEPSYKGRTLKKWVLQSGRLYYDHPERNKEASEAIAIIGTNSIPYLLKWIQYKPSFKLYKFYDNINEFSRKHELPDYFRFLTRDEKDELARSAADAFKILGSNAEGVIPELVALMNNTNRHIFVRAHAARALSGIGEKSFPYLMQALTNGPPTAVAHIIYNLGGLGTNARPAIPALINFLQDPNPNIVACAAWALGTLSLEPTVVVPALTSCLTNSQKIPQAFALQSLGQFGSDARSAMPALQQLLTNTTPNLPEHDQVLHTLHLIDSNAFPNPSP